MRRRWRLLAVLSLAACTPDADPAHPALWEVTGPKGGKAWLFGTVHALPRPVRWRSAAVDSAFEQADRIVVEVDDLGDDERMAAIFTHLSRSTDRPPLSQRVAPDLRDDLARLLDKAGLRESEFADVETWAAALMLARVGRKPDESDNGVDRAVIDAANGKPLVELEGAEAQLGIFDALPEKEQRDLLQLVVAEDGQVDDEGAALAKTWRQGDMRAIEAETRRGLLADPELREALFVRRNRDWTARIAAMLTHGERPFVAVGAAHMAGPDGLPAMLRAKGFEVKRVQ